MGVQGAELLCHWSGLVKKGGERLCFDLDEVFSGVALEGEGWVAWGRV